MPKKLVQAPILLLIILLTAGGAAAAGNSDVDAKHVFAAVEALRQLDLKKPVRVRKTGWKEVRARVPSIREAYGLDPASAARREKALKFLNLIPKDADLGALAEGFAEQQARSGYDPVTETILIEDGAKVSQWKSPLIRRAMTQISITEDELDIARDTAYALLYQNFGALKPPPENISLDQFMARRAVLDGGATLTAMDYIVRDTGLSILLLPNPEAIVDYFFPLVSHIDREKFDAAPGFVRSWYNFPFVKGTWFVFQQRKTGKYYLVDAAYRRAPLSTEQIIHPEKYFEKPDNPIGIVLPNMAADVGPGARLVYEDTWGEWGLSALLTEWLGGKRGSAAGWGGDRVAMYEIPGGGMTAAWFTTWDSPDAARDFEQALARAWPQRLLREGLRMNSRLIGRDVAFIVSDAEIPEALINRLWESLKVPVFTPPPVPEKPDPEDLRIEYDELLTMLVTQTHTPKQDETWEVRGDEFVSRKYKYSVTRPNRDWEYQRIHVGTMFLSEFTALNKKETGATMTVFSFDKYGPDAPNPVEEMVAVIGSQSVKLTKTGERKMMLNGHPARAVEYDAYAFFNMRIEYIEIFGDDYNYVVTIWAPVKAWEKLKADYQALLDSFKLLK